MSSSARIRSPSLRSLRPTCSFRTPIARRPSSRQPRDGLARVDQLDAGCVLTREHVIGGDPMFRLVCNDAHGRAHRRRHCTRCSTTSRLPRSRTPPARPKRALDLSVQHAKDRHQFGRPVGSFQAVAHRCADMRAEVDACRVLGHRAAWALARGRGRNLRSQCRARLRQGRAPTGRDARASGTRCDRVLHRARPASLHAPDQGVRVELRQHGVASGTVRAGSRTPSMRLSDSEHEALGLRARPSDSDDFAARSLARLAIPPPRRAHPASSRWSPATNTAPTPSSTPGSPVPPAT